MDHPTQDPALPDADPPPVVPGKPIEVPHHAHCSGGGTLRMQVEHVGPTFTWHGGTLWQEVYGVDIDPDGEPRCMTRRVATVRLNAVRRLERRR